MNLLRFTPIFLLALAGLGCENETAHESTSTTTQESPIDNSQINNDRASIAQTRDNETQWEDTTGTGTIGKSTEFKKGDLVPCPDRMAEFSLAIDACRKDVVYYRFSQTFCHYQDGSFDPRKESGMSSLGTNLTDLVGGSLSGNHFYVRLTPDSATIRINWNVTQNRQSERFPGEFDVVLGGNGSVDLGNEKQLKWSFETVDKESFTVCGIFGVALRMLRCVRLSVQPCKIARWRQVRQFGMACHRWMPGPDFVITIDGLTSTRKRSTFDAANVPLRISTE